MSLIRWYFLDRKEKYSDVLNNVFWQPRKTYFLATQGKAYSHGEQNSVEKYWVNVRIYWKILKVFLGDNEGYCWEILKGIFVVY